MGDRLLAPLTLGALLATACGDEDAGPAAPPPEPVPLTVMSFNVLCSLCSGADYDPWDERLGMFEDVLARHRPDLLGLQEIMFPFEVEQVLGETYDGIWFSGHDEFGQEAAFPDSTVAWDSERFEEREHGFFWLSPEPDKPFSSGFADGGQLPRVVAWARLADLEHGGELVFVTTHFDPNSPSQELSAPLFLERLAPLAQGAPLVITGDFNSKPSTPAYRTLVEGTDGVALTLTDAHELAAEVERVSTEEPPPAYDPDGRIDYVFLAGDGVRWEVERFRVDLTRYGEEPRFPSDHRALSAEATLIR